MDSFLGEIRMFAGTYAPVGWMFCDGTILRTADYPALFSLIGKTYGGDGRSTFGLPDLRGRVPQHRGDSLKLGEVTATAAEGSGAGRVLVVNFIIAMRGVYPAQEP